MSKDSNEPNDTEKRKYTTPSKSPMVAQVSAVAYEILDNAVFHINKPTITARAEVMSHFFLYFFSHPPLPIELFR